jgi:hypothetical protein
MLEGAEKRLEYTTEQDRTIRERAYTFLTILLPSIALFFGYLTGKPPAFMESISLHWKALLACLFAPVLFAISVLIWMVFPRLFYSKGRTPKELYDIRFVEGPLTNDEQLCGMFLSSLEKLQDEIKYNDAVNRGRVLWLQRVLWILSAWLLLLLLVLLSR